jgi:ATP-dependent DNA helicase RecG
MAIMTKEKIKEILLQGEGIEVEFKTASLELNKDTFDSICAFLNRKGGHLLLGVKNNGTVEGVIEGCVQKIINNIITSANNSGKLFPPFYFSPQILDYEGKKIIYLYVPESSHVHNTNGRIFDRNGDGDLDITRHSGQVMNLYLRKQSTYSENQVFPYLELADCKPELFTRVRRMVVITQKNHPWISMTDMEIIHSAGLYKKDSITGKNGMTLAAALLFGKDTTLLSVLPHHKTDAILRVENLDRYDDRDDIRTNLIESYDRLMAFIGKHLSDKFYLEGTQRISLRDRLFREIVSNMLIHREFANGFPAKLIIERDRVYTENWNRPHGLGIIDPQNFIPFSKNPVIARFFKEIGHVDELGSGIRNVFKYGPAYTPGAQPEFIEEDVFKAIIPLKAKTGEQGVTPLSWEEVRRKVRRKFGEKFGESSEKMLELIFQEQNISAVGLSAKIGISARAVEKQLAKLKDIGVIERIGADRGGYWIIMYDK